MLSILGLTSVNAQDWPDLNHFEVANDTIEQAKENENRVVFMGNPLQ